MAQQQKREFRKPRVEEKDEFEKKMVDLRSVSKTVKGGRNRRFSALVVVGDKKGKVGMGINKAVEVPAAIDKATKAAKKALVNVPIVEGTIPHEVIGTFGTSKVVMFPAPEGTGVIAGGGARNLLELCGIKNITCKSFGSRNSINNIKAAMNALLKLQLRQGHTDDRASVSDNELKSLNLVVVKLVESLDITVLGR